MRFLQFCVIVLMTILNTPKSVGQVCFSGDKTFGAWCVDPESKVMYHEWSAEADRTVFKFWLRIESHETRDSDGQKEYKFVLVASSPAGRIDYVDFNHLRYVEMLSVRDFGDGDPFTQRWFFNGNNSLVVGHETMVLADWGKQTDLMTEQQIRNFTGDEEITKISMTMHWKFPQGRELVEMYNPVEGHFTRWEPRYLTRTFETDIDNNGIWSAFNYLNSL